VTTLEGKRIWVAGHTGMVGAALVRALARLDGVTLLTASHGELDLRDPGATRAWAAAQRPDLVFVAAARVGGILANAARPVDFLEDNLLIAASVIHAAHATGVEKLLFLGSSCAYPRLAPQPIREAALLGGPLEPTNQGYAVAKIAGVLLCDAYRQQYGADFVSAMPTNLYGPNDNDDPEESHVLAAAIRKIRTAQASGAAEVTIWGTGAPLREFMHVDDLAAALLVVMASYSAPGPINIGSGEEVSILALHELVAQLSGWRGRFVFDASKPDGTPRKRLDCARLEALGFQARIGLEEGIRRTLAGR
jgi:GDP-L-fucose synthase